VDNVFRALRLSPATVLRFSLPHRFRQRYSLQTWKLGERRLSPSEQFSIPT
jgi:hypothetical protein